MTTASGKGNTTELFSSIKHTYLSAENMNATPTKKYYRFGGDKLYLSNTRMALRLATAQLRRKRKFLIPIINGDYFGSRHCHILIQLLCSPVRVQECPSVQASSTAKNWNLLIKPLMSTTYLPVLGIVAQYHTLAIVYP